MTPDMSSSDVCFGSNLYGVIYSVGTIKVCGATAYGNILAETSVSGNVNLVSPAQIYTQSTNPSIRTQVPQQVSFSQLTVSLANIKRAAALNSPSTVFDDSTAAAWQINFSPDGTFQVWKCVFVSGAGNPDPAYAQPYCDNLTLSTVSTTSSHGNTTTTITTNGGTDGLPSTGTIYIGPNSSGKTDTFNYSGRSSTATTTTFTGSGSLTYTHSAGERVSYYSAAPWAEPYYSGAIPANNAIYTGQDAIVSWPTAVSGFSGTGCPSYVGTPASAVNGRVTVGSNTDVIVAGDLCYSSQTSGNANDDVLGLVANNNVWIADYAPNNLWWRSASIALTGTWGDYDCTNGKSGPYNNSMTFVGTMAYATANGCMDSGSVGYHIANVNRVADDGSMATISQCPTTAPDCASYNALEFLFPPWFPVLDGENIGLFQEVPPSTLLPVG
jgi:hypothetical protein